MSRLFPSKMIPAVLIFTASWVAMGLALGEHPSHSDFAVAIGCIAGWIMRSWYD